jgi:hypothetical protein
MADALKDLMTQDASKKFIRQISKGGGLRFFVKQEEKMLLKNDAKEFKDI